MVVLNINGQEIQCLIDTGATMSCVRQAFPMTSKTMSISGCVVKPENKTVY